MKKQIRWHQMLKIILLVTFSHFIASCDKDIFDGDHEEKVVALQARLAVQVALLPQIGMPCSYR